MDIKDLAGLSEPLKKLIEVISNGVGALTKPYLIKKTADAKAYEIRAIAQAVRENQIDLKEIGYEEEKVQLKSLDVDTLKQELTIEERVKNRIDYKEQKKQRNIETITQYAAINLDNEKSVSEEPVDDDWTSRFFNYAEDISNEEMQELWGRILAGEIKQPNSFSLRTLEFVRNLSKQEAQVFTKAANFVISSWNSPFIFKGNGDETLGNWGLSFEERLLLTEIGILQAESNITRRLLKSEQDTNIIFESGRYVIRTTKKANSAEHHIPILRFSKVGIELLHLLKINPSEEYIKEFCNSIDSENINVEYAYVLAKQNGQYQHTQPWLKFEKNK